MKLFKGYFILIGVSLLLYLIVSMFVHDEKAIGGIVSLIIVLFVMGYGIFSVKKNVKILKEIPRENNVKQDLVINGIRLESTLRTNSMLKLAFWAFLYSVFIVMAIKLIAERC